jgi:transposase
MPGRDQYKANDFIAEIPGSGGIISAIARRVGCDWHTAKKYIEKYATVKKAYEAEREGLLDLAEAKLIERVKEGDPWAIKYLLGKLGAHRGFGDKLELEASGEVKIVVVYENE